MTDARLRALERRWTETGSVEDEVELLGERLRAGALTRPWLELAAYLGHEPAARALGPSVFTLERMGWSRQERPEVVARSDFRALVGGLELWGIPVLVRGLIALGQLALRRFAEARPDEGRPGAYLRAAEAWVLDPTEAACARIEAEAVAFSDLSMEAQHLPPGWESALLPPLLCTIQEPCDVIVIATRGRHPRFEPADRDRRMRLWIEPVDGRIPESTAAVAAELVPWALGRLDPLRARLERPGSG